jgi:hypothetical protein
MANKIIRNYVAKKLYEQGGTIANRKSVDFSTAAMAERLTEFGIDPRLINTESELIGALNIVKQMQDKAFDKKFSGILKTGKVIRADFGKPFKEEIKKMETEGEIAKRIKKDNKKGIANIQKRILEEDREIENLYGGAGFGKDQEIDAEFLAEYLAENAGKVYDDLPTMERLDFYDRAFNALTRYKRTKGTSVIDEPKKLDPRTKEKMDDIKEIEDPEDLATGGRAGFKMGRRAFLKALGAGIGGAAALKSGIVSLGGKTAGKEAVKQVVKTPSVAGKPEWFDSLVNKVIREGDDVTKNFATKEREIVHKLDVDKFEDVKVTQDLDEGLIRVEYNSPNNMGEDTVELVFKKGRPEEEGMMPDEFYAVEKEPRAVGGPEDADLEFDGENLVKNVDDLQSDTSKLKQVATGKKQTMSEFVNSKKKKDRVKSINEDQVEQAEYLETKYGPYERYLSEDVDADFASGGIARMLGE